MSEQNIFLAALEQPAATRAVWLAQACRGDPQLRERVEALLRQQESASDFLERPLLVPSQFLAEEVAGDAGLNDAAPGQDPLAAYLQTVLTPADQAGCLGRLRQYQILEVIGQGAMGVVLKARDSKLNRIVAIKILGQRHAADALAKKRFLREARAAAAVTHPNVVTIHAVDEERVPFLVMEFIDGKSVEQKLRSAGVLDLPEILRIGSQLAAGLAAAHKQGLIHRDIKPANILLENGVERVKITDFGLARVLDDDPDLSLPGTISGTPSFMSPEQARGARLDFRTDLFSLGSVLYALCTGRPPFRGENLMAVVHQVVTAAPPSIRSLNEQIPDWCCEIIAKLQEKNPNDRFDSAAAVADVLESRLRRLQQPFRMSAAEESDSQTTPFTSASSASARRLRSLWLAIGGGLVTAVLILGASLYSSMRSQHDLNSAGPIASAPNGSQDPPSPIGSALAAAAVASYSRIVDDRDPDYRETQREGLSSEEGWQSGGDRDLQRQAFGNRYRYNNRGAMTASWIFAGVPPGEYEIWMTWPTAPQSTAKARVHIQDGPDIVSSHWVDMGRPPGDAPRSTRHAGSTWAWVDSIRISTGTAQVQINARVSKGNRPISCDAVWLRSKDNAGPRP